MGLEDWLVVARKRKFSPNSTVQRLMLTYSRLSKHLYSTDTRFVYELIQNAEDNSYSIAAERNDLPALTFSVSSERIVIDSNEDGFCEANVRAICRVGESTKANIKGYIGEKGIGFKSVFKVARKVHVQSGPYSFAFDYDKEQPDSGLGMVTPLNEPYSELPRGTRTRIVLYLHMSCDKEALVREFDNLPDTLLLFLRKLKRLSLRIERPGNTVVEKAYELTSTGNRACMKRTIGRESVDLNFWIARKTVSDMPEDEAREGTEGTERIKEAEVVLGFPLNEGDMPVVADQHVFAFLPLRKVGFKVSFIFRFQHTS